MDLYQHPFYRTTLDLYNEDQTDKLLRSLCDRWALKLVEVSTSIYHLTLQLEEYRLEQLKFKGHAPKPDFEPNPEERKQALKMLKNP